MIMWEPDTCVQPNGCRVFYTHERSPGGEVVAQFSSFEHKCDRHKALSDMDAMFEIADEQYKKNGQVMHWVPGLVLKWSLPVPEHIACPSSGSARPHFKSIRP